jgi:hypothetical protein
VANRVVAYAPTTRIVATGQEIVLERAQDQSDVVLIDLAPHE